MPPGTSELPTNGRFRWRFAPSIRTSLERRREHPSITEPSCEQSATIYHDVRIPGRPGSIGQPSVEGRDTMPAMARRSGFTSFEARVDAAARRRLSRAPRRGVGGMLVEFGVFGAKQAWACIFGGLLLGVLLAARLFYPEDAALARNDALVIAAVLLQLSMVLTGLETPRELIVILVFHVVGTVMELFKTDVGSWAYDPGGVLRIASVPLFTGFMYGAVGSYLVRVYRLFDLRFTRFPPRWLATIVAAAIYANFFTEHFWFDARWVLFPAVVAVFGASVMEFRVYRHRFRMPLVVAFALVAVFIWLAENIATFSQAWTYPDQADGWHPVSAAKLVSWFLLMIISVVLVVWVSPPRRPDRDRTPVEE